MGFLDAPINLGDLPENTGGDFSPLPAGEYTATIKSADITPTKDNTGQYIKLRLDITGPSHAGRVVFSNINIRNKSPRAEEIGRQQLGDIMRAVGLASLTDTDQLLGGSLTVKLKVRNDPTYGDSNEVQAYKAIKGSAPPMPASNPAPAAAAGAAPPWAKK
jgi:hypothetical protein